MTTLRDIILSTNLQRISFTARINGRVVPDVFEVGTSHGFDQINGQATIACYRRPVDAEEGATCELWAGYNGVMAQIFGGELSGVAWDYFPAGVVLEGVGVLARTRQKWQGADRTYTSQDDAAVIRNLLEAHGIPNTAANIESSGWTLGQILDVVLKGDGTDSAWRLIEEIDRYAGYKTFTISTGVIFRRRVSGQSGPSPFWTFTKGVDLLRVRRNRTRDGIVNSFVMTGLTYEGADVSGSASAPNPYLPNPTGYNGDGAQSNLVETDPIALDIAERMVNDKNRRPEGLDIECIGNPLLQPGQTVAIDNDEIEATAGAVFVENVSHRISGASFTTTVRTSGGNLSGFITSPPVAQFSVQLFLEGVDTGSGITPRLVGIADGTQSFDTDSDVPLTYAWSASLGAGTVQPASGTAPVYRFVADSPAGAVLTIDLVVTDSDGLEGSAGYDNGTIDTAQLAVEALYTAEGTLVAYSGDGQQSWSEQSVPSGNATALMPIAPAWGELWGTSSGHIYASIDGLASALVDLGQPHGAVACTAVWVHETDSTRLWAAFADGLVYYGVGSFTATSASVSWSAQGTVPASPIAEIRESYGTYGELRATAGSAEYISQDAGASWDALVSGAGTATATRMAAGFETNAVAFRNDPTPIRYESVSSPTFPVLSPPVESITGISFGYRQQELYAADSQAEARVFRSDEDFAVMELVGTAPTDINHLLRSGNEDGIVYGAGGTVGDEGGVLKSLRGESWWYARRTGTRPVYMVGYGTPIVAQVPVVGHVLIPTWGVAGANDGIWRIQDGVATQITPPQAGWFWWHIDANPFNPNQLLLLGNDYAGGLGNVFYERQFTIVAGEVRAHNETDPVLYYSSDGGATWSAVTLTVPSFPSGTPTIVWLRHGAIFDSRVNGNWILAGDTRRSGYGEVGTIWRGSAGAQTSYVNLTSPGATWLFAAASGIAGETFVIANAEIRAFSINRTASAATDRGSFDICTSLDRLPGTSRAIVATGSNNTYAATDYRDSATAFAARLGAAQHACALANNDMLVIDGSSASGTLLHITDLFGTPATESLDSGCVTVATGRVTHRVAAACVPGTAVPTPELVLRFYDGSAWQSIATPLLISDISNITTIAVIETPDQ